MCTITGQLHDADPSEVLLEPTGRLRPAEDSGVSADRLRRAVFILSPPGAALNGHPPTEGVRGLPQPPATARRLRTRNGELHQQTSKW